MNITPEISAIAITSLERGDHLAVYVEVGRLPKERAECIMHDVYTQVKDWLGEEHKIAILPMVDGVKAVQFEAIRPPPFFGAK